MVYSSAQKGPDFRVRFKLKGNDIKTGSTTGFDYWAAYINTKIKTDRLKWQVRTDDITR